MPDLTFEQADTPKQEDEASYPFLIDLPTPLKRSKELVDIAVPVWELLLCHHHQLIVLVLLLLQKLKPDEFFSVFPQAVVSKRSVRRYCGEQLVSTLQLACQKHGKRRRKRTAGATNVSECAAQRSLRSDRLQTLFFFLLLLLLPPPTSSSSQHPMLASEWTSGEMTEKEVEEAIYKGMMQAYHGMLTSKPPGELPRVRKVLC